jgi:DNA-binding response OmpR family regulator
MSTKVLVFEHDAAFAGELRRELTKLGCAVTVVDDGNAGLAQASSDRPDLILLSIELPRMNGFSVCNKLKKDPQLMRVPLVIMSSESSDETFEQHKKLRTRAEDYVHKPIAFGELLQHMRQFLPTIGEGAQANGEEDILIDEEIIVGDLDSVAPEDDNEMTQVGQLPPGMREQFGAKRAATSAPQQQSAADAEVDAFADAAFDNLLGGAGLV